MVIFYKRKLSFICSPRTCKRGELARKQAREWHSRQGGWFHPPVGGGTYADYLSYQEVDDHNYREGNFPEGKARKKDNRHS